MMPSEIGRSGVGASDGEFSLVVAARPQSAVARKIFASPNFGDRIARDGNSHARPDTLVLHYTGMPNAADALQWLANPLSQVSCHYFVFEDGRVLQMVPEEARAWHAGKAVWQGDTDINSRSIGIEIANPGHAGDYPDFPEAQIDAVIALCRDLCERWRIVPERVLAHSDVSPGRKIDPGEKFPWGRLQAAGIGHWVQPVALGGGRFMARGETGQPVEALQAMLVMYGYGLAIDGVYDDAMMAVVAAFQRHFRPALVDGVADMSTIATLRDLIAARRSSTA